MAPSTSKPTDLHRAPAACLQCRKAKVRCLVSHQLDRCDRCRSNHTECIFEQSKRTKGRSQPYPAVTTLPQTTTGHCHLPTSTPIQSTISHTASASLASDQTFWPSQQHRPSSSHYIPVITNAIRARILAALATVKGKRGSPFSFVTSGDRPSFDPGADSRHPALQNLTQQPSANSVESTPAPLKLSRLLRPLKVTSHSGNDEDAWRPVDAVKMPSYLSSMTLGQTMTDPIEGGVISVRASNALFEFFMIEVNAKWEYLLDPHIDTHDNVQRRSSLLLSTILFCASKFGSYTDGEITPAPDPFLQSRLCSLARNLAIRSIAEGNRSIEAMQAFYLLVCWKDADDDVSYLHSGYAFRVLHDLDLEQDDGDGRQMARRKRLWLALFRQDRQQSMFFMRRASLSPGDWDTSVLCDLNVWLKMPCALPTDFVACCSANLRHIQSKLRHTAQKATPVMLPYLLELMDAELSSWRTKWCNHLEGEGRAQANDDPSISSTLLYPGKQHLTTLVNIWENGIRLNIGSAILRQALLASVTSLSGHHQGPNPPLDINLSTFQECLSPSLPGLTSSVEGAFETLRQLMNIQPDDLRRSPDAILLLAPNSALFLCLLLCLPGEGVLGPAFQGTAVTLIRDISDHIRRAIQSPQDTVALHSAYLESLVELLDSPTSQSASAQQGLRVQPPFDMANMSVDTNGMDFDDPTFQAAQVLADGIGSHGDALPPNESIFGVSGEPFQNLHLQSLANLLDGQLFWEAPSAGDDIRFA